MNIKIGPFQAATRTVTVTFTDSGTDGDFVHRRDVNAVLTAAGTYDRVATRARVDQVAQGVVAKRALGVFDAPPAPAEPAAEDSAG